MPDVAKLFELYSQPLAAVTTQMLVTYLACLVGAVGAACSLGVQPAASSGAGIPGATPRLALVYSLFLTTAFVAYLIAGGTFSSMLTLSAIFQCLSLAIVAVQFATSGGAGISAKSLSLDALALCCRLSSTFWFDGYLPLDITGDFLYQAVDVTSLALVFWLLRRVTKSSTWQSEEDTLVLSPMAIFCVMLAALFHGDLNDHVLFDTLWLTGLLLSMLAVVPQLWLVEQTRRRLTAAEAGCAPGVATNPLASHALANATIGRLLSSAYMWTAGGEITCHPWWFWTFNHARWTILAAHVAHVTLLFDLAYRRYGGRHPRARQRAHKAAVAMVAPPGEYRM
eukprot:TRINITY_DN12307_c0_g1_i1.p1 TRINITY_DN12307_c0_g1~~TRINITY_DN12307_c0_g1_i1.p1  ORF type:complete len:339 (+),score=62.79 TRINITY_DN12307_c0_g1_i1:110-1126(+)